MIEPDNFRVTVREKDIGELWVAVDERDGIEGIGATPSRALEALADKLRQ